MKKLTQFLKLDNVLFAIYICFINWLRGGVCNILYNYLLDSKNINLVGITHQNIQFFQ